ncbi:hypothetical protein GUJ93_ZPchr0004g39743 [Zizania palustris]|uniref:Uncharacterized protein n=1 Tax=Zizania palustris TaxID=103762 RepID=A0A8J5SBM0_ZIZPA|nr:hypothetical protein GUJ93_ZPchr0004g39743 [Zizania palustris]
MRPCPHAPTLGSSTVASPPADHLRPLTPNFHTKKKVLEKMSILSSKQLRNEVASFTTHLMPHSSSRRRKGSAAWTLSRRSPRSRCPNHVASPSCATRL